MVTPLWSQLNFLASNYFFSWFLTPLLFSLNFWGKANIPAYSTGTFNEDGTLYNITSVLDQNGLLPLGSDPPPLKLSINRILVYGAAFASLSAVISQFFIYYFKKMKTLTTEKEHRDIHTRMMSKYPKVPIWIYIFILGLSVVLGLAVIRFHFDAFQLPFWGIPLALGISTIFITPIGIITAISNQSIGLNVVSEFIMGYLDPGNLLSNATFKVYGTNTLSAALEYARNVKMGYYMKLSTPLVLAAQIYGQVLSSISIYY